MGGKVLQLESERLLELGEARGRIIDSAEACRELYKEDILLLVANVRFLQKRGYRHGCLQA